MVENATVAQRSPKDRLAELDRKVPEMRKAFSEGLEGLNVAAGAAADQHGAWSLFSNPYVDTAGIGTKLRQEAETLWKAEEERERLRRDLGLDGLRAPE